MIRERVQVDVDIIETVEAKRLNWYGHMRRMEEERWPQKIWNWKLPWKRKRGRPKLTWQAGTQDAMSKRNILEDEWKNRKIWKKLVNEKHRTV